MSFNLRDNTMPNVEQYMYKYNHMYVSYVSSDNKIVTNKDSQRCIQRPCSIQVLPADGRVMVH